ncbi:hypothetical protein MPSEU_000932900 [Mayamaea pseudoterrestris]|nr:hypothetical protein MPSEU_000932900 [Mayamaea pseudoterrestris]
MASLPVNPYAKSSISSSTGIRDPVSTSKALITKENETKQLPLSMPTKPSPVPSISPLLPANKPIDKKIKLKNDIETLKRMNEAKKKQLELEKQRRKEEKRQRKLEALRKEQCEKNGIEYVPLLVKATVTETLSSSPVTSSNAATAVPGASSVALPSNRVSLSPMAAAPPPQDVPHNQQPNITTSIAAHASTIVSSGSASASLGTDAMHVLRQSPVPASNHPMQPPILPIYMPALNQQFAHPPYGYHPFQPNPWMQMHFPHPSMQFLQPHSASMTQPQAPPMHSFPTFGPTPFGHPMAGTAVSQPMHSYSAILPKLELNKVPSPSTRSKSNVPAASVDRLSSKLLQPPSPFAISHYWLPDVVTIIKRPTDTSFGMTLRKKDALALINADANENESTTHDHNGNDIEATHASTKVEKRFYALSIDRCEEQNARHEASLPEAKLTLLQADDIILSINGRTTSDLTFEEAIQLIKTCSTTDAQGTVTCKLTLARRKIVTPLTTIEMGAYSSCVIKALAGLKRVALGKNEIPDADLILDPMLCSRNLEQLRFEWERMRSQMQVVMTQKATEHWKATWANESLEIRQQFGVEKFMSDSQRSTLRAATKPATGCQCGAADHKYVYDVKCPLYSNLRHLSKQQSTEPVLTMEEEMKRMKAILPASKDLKTLEKAYKDRFIREQVDKKFTQREEDFISEMEEIQIRDLKQAVRSPKSLTAVVLSAVFEVCPEFLQTPHTGSMFVQSADVETPASSELSSHTTGGFDDEVVDDDDDDVPLVQLAKRPRTEANKTQKGGTLQVIRPKFLAKLLHTISHKWGHLYSEPDNPDYIWRWEIFHCGNDEESKGCRKEFARNPRAPGGLCLENIRFVIDEIVIKALESDHVEERSRALSLLSMVISPTVSGVTDELLSLCKSGVLRLDDEGIPVPTHDWWAHVDLIMLEDMHQHWGNKPDPRGLCGISNKMRKALGRKWQRNSLGWSFTNNVEQTVFDFYDYDEWRDGLELKMTSSMNFVQGVGRFGI